MTITERDGTGKITRQTGRVEAPGALAATWGSAPPPKPAPSGFAIDPKEADILRIAAERRNAMLDEHLGSFMVNEELKRVVPPEQYEPLSDEQTRRCRGDRCDILGRGREGGRGGVGR